jgi:trimeric autotransporter adhesin
VTLTATITSSPAGAQKLPTLSFGSTSPVNINGATAGTATLTVTTTAPVTSALTPPARPHGRWYAAGETVLACVLLFGFPARRRRWRAMLGMMLLLAGLTSAMTACGGGGSTNLPHTPTTTPGTTAGTYVVTVTGANGVLSASGTLRVVVQ